MALPFLIYNVPIHTMKMSRRKFNYKKRLKLKNNSLTNEQTNDYLLLVTILTCKKRARTQTIVLCLQNVEAVGALISE